MVSPHIGIGQLFLSHKWFSVLSILLIIRWSFTNLRDINYSICFLKCLFFLMSLLIFVSERERERDQCAAPTHTSTGTSKQRSTTEPHWPGPKCLWKPRMLLFFILNCKYFFLEKIIPENVNHFITYRFLQSSHAIVTKTGYPKPSKLSSKTVINTTINTSLASFYKYVQTPMCDGLSICGATVRSQWLKGS